MTISILSFFLLINSWTFHGIVEGDHGPLPDVTVKVIDGDQVLTSASNGKGEVTFAELTSDSVRVIVSAEGYVPLDGWVERGEQARLIQLRPLETQVETITIEAIRAGNYAPLTQTTLSKAQLEANYFGQDMPYLLTQTPSLTAYSDGGIYTGYSYLRLRGLDMTRLNFTLNGVPLNEPEDQGVYFSNFADFGNSVRSVQVQRGVGSSTHGAAAFGGSVNFISENPFALKPSAEVQLGYGSFNSFRYAAEAQTGLIDHKFGFYTRYSGTGTDGYRYHSGACSHSFFGSGGWLGDQNMVKVTAFTGQVKNQMAYLATDINDIRVDPRINYLSPDEKDDFAQDFAQVEYSHSFSPELNLAASIYYQRVAGDFDVLVDSTLLNFKLDSDFEGAMVNLNYEADKLKLRTGLNGNLYRRDHSMVIKPWINSNIYFNQGFKQEISAFAKGEYWVNKIMLYGDLQLRHAAFQYVPEASYGLSVNPVSWTFFNPKVGITYKHSSALSTYLSAGQTTREPTRTDMFGGNDDIDPFNYAQLSNLSRVRPETVTDFEAGANWTFRPGYLKANLYAMEFRNEIAAIGQLSYIGLPLRKNVAASFRRGLELELLLRPAKGWHTGANLNLSWNRIKSYTTDYDSLTYQNVQPLLTPPVLANAFVNYQFKKILELEARARYQAASFLDNTNDANLVAPAYFLLDLRAVWHFYQQHSISIQLNNVLNQEYYTSGYAYLGSPSYFVQAPRNFFVTLHLKF
ncbi:MAG: TonB-dependent receptor [Bacteroidia bacterium]|nr:TonB-dependent receptor [Bacteroidia bacterium]